MQHRTEVGVSLGTQIVLLIAPGARESGYIRRPVADIRAQLGLNRLGVVAKARVSQQPSLDQEAKFSEVVGQLMPSVLPVTGCQSMLEYSAVLIQNTWYRPVRLAGVPALGLAKPVSLVG